jgi:hypothetical protein
MVEFFWQSEANMGESTCEIRFELMQIEHPSEYEVHI